MRAPPLLVPCPALSGVGGGLVCVPRFPGPADRVPAALRPRERRGVLECSCVTALASSQLALNFSLLY